MIVTATYESLYNWMDMESIQLLKCASFARGRCQMYNVRTALVVSCFVVSVCVVELHTMMPLHCVEVHVIPILITCK